MIEDSKRAEIKREAKLILDKFSKALAGVEASESNVVRDNDRRDEGEGTAPPGVSSEEGNSEFREIMFENAPQKNKDFIIAEKKLW